MISNVGAPLDRVVDLLLAARGAVEAFVYRPTEAAHDDLVDMLMSVPATLCEELVQEWSVATLTHTNAEIEQRLTCEDRLLLDMLLAMYDHRRTNLVREVSKTPTISDFETGEFRAL